MTNNNTPFDPTKTSVPRMDLREPAFRKYEPYIIRALERSYIVDTKLSLAIKPHTFITRFRDAILGLKRYRYSSAVAHDTDFSHIKLFELVSGEVYVRNIHNDIVIPTAATTDATKKTYHAGRDAAEIDSLLRRMHNRELEGVFYVTYDTDAQRDSLLALSCAGVFDPVTKTEICGDGPYDVRIDLGTNNTILLKS